MKEARLPQAAYPGRHGMSHPNKPKPLVMAEADYGLGVSSAARPRGTSENFLEVELVLAAVLLVLHASIRRPEGRLSK